MYITPLCSKEISLFIPGYYKYVTHSYIQTVNS